MSPLLSVWLCLLPLLAAAWRAVRPWIFPLTAYGLIAYGASRIYEPAGPLAVGLLLWFDLFTFQRRG